MVRVRPSARPRAAASGLKSYLAMAFSTAFFSASLTLAVPLMMRETVLGDTPASCAITRSVIALRGRGPRLPPGFAIVLTRASNVRPACLPKRCLSAQCGFAGTNGSSECTCSTDCPPAIYAHIQSYSTFITCKKGPRLGRPNVPESLVNPSVVRRKRSTGANPQYIARLRGHRLSSNRYRTHLRDSEAPPQERNHARCNRPSVAETALHEVCDSTLSHQ